MSILDIRRRFQEGGSAGNLIFDYRSNPIYQNFLQSPFYQPGPSAQVISPVQLPTGEILNLPNAGMAEQFRQYLSSTPAGGAPVTIPTPVPSPTMPTPTIPTPTIPTPTTPTPVLSSPMSLPTTPEPTIPGFQSFSGSGKEGIMNLLASRFRDLNLGMMNRLRNNPGSFYSRIPLDQTSSMPSGLQNLFFRSGNNLTEIPNSTNMIRRTAQRPSYTNTGIATSFTPNFVPFEIRKRRR